MEFYEELQIIGKGSFGIVTKIKRKSDGKELVWKSVNYGHMSEREKQLIVSEVNLLRELRHPHIVQYYDRIIDKRETKIYIIMEYCQNGDLGRLIRRKKKERKYIDESFIWRIFSHILSALKKCHHHREGNKKKPILHRDIKPGNIFLDATGVAKLGDFGLARELSHDKAMAQTNVGTPYYMSPEVVKEESYDETSDIWAFGCLLYEMASLLPPFDAKNHLTLAQKITAGKFDRIPSLYSNELAQMIHWMLCSDRTQRPRTEDLENYPPFLEKIQSFLFTPEKSIHNRAKKLLQLEKTLAIKEKQLNERERQLKEFENHLLIRENNLRKKKNIISNEVLSCKNNTSHKILSFNSSSSGSLSCQSTAPSIYGSSPPNAEFNKMFLNRINEPEVV